MEPPLQLEASSAATKKLRIMCSYGGHIVPRPRTKSLCYAGGETRIVSVDPATVATLSSLTAQLSSTLSIPTPFSLKYQLPNHDLDSLISLLTDDDLLIMLDELHRLSSSSSSSGTPSRIRLFVFSSSSSSFHKPEFKSSHSVIHHPKTESWFVDALKSAKIMQKGRNCLLGFEGDGQNSEFLGGGDLFGNGIGSMAESMVLETSSSFGSTSSSASLTSLAPIKSNVDESGSGLQDNKVKLTPPEAFASESSVSTATSCPQIGAYQDPVIHVVSTDNRVSSNPAELEIKGPDVSSGIQGHISVMASPYQVNPPLDQFQPQKPQYILQDSPYIPQNQTPAGLVPISSLYPLYHTQLHQQQLVPIQYQPNQPSPVYLVPVAPPQAYNMAGYHSFIENSSQTPVHLNASYISPQVVHNEPTQTDASPNLASQVYNTAHSASLHVATPMLQVPYNENQPQSFALFQKQQQPQPQSQSIAIAFRESPKQSNELDVELARVQIYKSQPPPPSCPSQYKSLSNATTVMLSEALAQLHTDNLKEQIRTSQPQ